MSEIAGAEILEPALIQQLHDHGHRPGGVALALFDHLDLSLSDPEKIGERCCGVAASLADGLECCRVHGDVLSCAWLPSRSVACGSTACYSRSALSDGKARRSNAGPSCVSARGEPLFQQIEALKEINIHEIIVDPPSRNFIAGQDIVSTHIRAVIVAKGKRGVMIIKNDADTLPAREFLPRGHAFRPSFDSSCAEGLYGVLALVLGHFVHIIASSMEGLIVGRSPILLTSEGGMTGIALALGSHLVDDGQFGCDSHIPEAPLHEPINIFIGGTDEPFVRVIADRVVVRNADAIAALAIEIGAAIAVAVRAGFQLAHFQTATRDHLPERGRFGENRVGHWSAFLTGRDASSLPDRHLMTNNVREVNVNMRFASIYSTTGRGM